MFQYIVKRIVQMIPTVFGVILITFILFNVVGGSPAAMTLGRHVTPRALEEFDELRGFNKPLFFGRWTKTRALEDADFRQGAGAWRAVKGAEWVEGSHIALSKGGPYLWPLAFPLRADTEYRVDFEYRTSDNARAVFFPIIGKKMLPISNDWKKMQVDFRTDEKAEPSPGFEVIGGRLEIRSVVLRRGTKGLFDSQLVFYLKQIARFDFGTSSSLNQPVSRLLLNGLVPSLMLTVPIFFVELIVSIAISLLCAFFRGTWLDRFFVVISVALMSVNYLVWIVVGQYLLGFKWGWVPVWGFASAGYLLLPVFVGVFSGLGVNIRFYRTIMLDEMYKDYVRTAFAKGVSRSGVLFRHVLKNAMIPIVTNVVIAIPFLYTGSLLLESFFGIPGLGYLGVNAINSSDVDVVRALVFIGSVMFVIANLLTDICYAWLDPRVKFE